jgi:hypothetical protein
MKADIPVGKPKCRSAPCRSQHNLADQPLNVRGRDQQNVVIGRVLTLIGRLPITEKAQISLIVAP